MNRILIIKAITLLNIGIASHSPTIFNEKVSQIEKMLNITLPYREFEWETFSTAALYQEQDLKVILEKI